MRLRSCPGVNGFAPFLRGPPTIATSKVPIGGGRAHRPKGRFWGSSVVEAPPHLGEANWGRVRAFYLKQVEISRPRHRPRAAVCAELAVRVVDVGLDGAQGDVQLSRDLPVGFAGGDMPQHLQLALAQGFR